MGRINWTTAPAIWTIAAMMLVSPAPPSGAATLYGNVSHSEFLEPLNDQNMSLSLRGKAVRADIATQANQLPQSMKPSSIHRQNQPSVETPDVSTPPTSQRFILWLPVPKWLAGTWIKQGDMTVSHTDLRTGIATPMSVWTQNVQTTTWGNQIDAQGNIWHGYSIPTEIDGMSNGRLVRFVMLNGQQEPSPPGHVVTRVRSVVFTTQGGQLVDAFQQETLNDLTLLPSGELENHGFTRDFTKHGQPTREALLVSRFSKVRNFQIVETQDGVDLLRSLNDFLRSNNMSQLIRNPVVSKI